MSNRVDDIISRVRNHFVGTDDKKFSETFIRQEKAVFDGWLRGKCEEIKSLAVLHAGHGLANERGIGVVSGGVDVEGDANKPSSVTLREGDADNWGRAVFRFGTDGATFNSVEITKTVAGKVVEDYILEPGDNGISLRSRVNPTV